MTSTAENTRNWRARNPERYREWNRNYKRKNKDRINARAREIKAANPEKNRERNKAWRDANRERQSKRCRDWRDSKREIVYPRTTACEICAVQGTMYWDHDHITGKHRGWLCNHCNLAIGQLKDNPEVMRQAALYIEQRSTQPKGK